MVTEPYSYDRRWASSIDMALVNKLAAKYARILEIDDLPKFTVKNNLRSPWLGRHLWKFGQPSVIELQATLFDNEETLERVIAHEMAHHAVVADAEAGDGSTLVELIRDPTKAHGAEWKEYAKKINQAVGDSGFVTEYTDHQTSETSKSYYLWIEHEVRHNRLRYSVAGKLSAAMRSAMARGLQAGTGKLLEVTDPQWLGGPGIGRGSIVPKSPELKAALQKLWDEN